MNRVANIVLGFALGVLIALGIACEWRYLGGSSE